MNRIFDLIAVACVAVVVLLPRASVEAKPALTADAVEMSRVAALEDAFVREPKSETAATDLAEAYLRLDHPDWALVTLSGFAGQTAKLHLLRATAWAERLDAPSALASVTEGRAICAAQGCPPAVAARLDVIGAPMQALVDGKIDPRSDPAKAKEAVGKMLHNTRSPLPTK